MDGWIIKQINRQTDDRVINIKNNRWMDGWMDGWIDRLTDRQMIER